MEFWGNSYTFQQLWTPAAISTALWLDAADASTITTVSGGVSEWRDKSGYERHFSQATIGIQPVYATNVLNNKNVINFVSADSLTRSAIPFNDLGNNSLYVVSNRTGRPSQYNVVIILTRAQFRIRNMVANYSSANAGKWGTYTTADFPSPSGSINASYSINLMVADQATNAYLFYQNGTYQGSNGVVNVNATGFTDGACWIGNDQYNSSLEGNIAEVVFCNEKNSDLTRQRIEGYLAHKWGLTANLPSDHPYKSTPPYL
jgi:hypothetical protein